MSVAGHVTLSYSSMSVAGHVTLSYSSPSAKTKDQTKTSTKPLRMSAALLTIPDATKGVTNVSSP